MKQISTIALLIELRSRLGQFCQLDNCIIGDAVLTEMPVDVTLELYNDINQYTSDYYILCRKSMEVACDVCEI